MTPDCSAESEIGEAGTAIVSVAVEPGKVSGEQQCHVPPQCEALE